MVLFKCIVMRRYFGHRHMCLASAAKRALLVVGRLLVAIASASPYVVLMLQR